MQDASPPQRRAVPFRVVARRPAAPLRRGPPLLLLLHREIADHAVAMAPPVAAAALGLGLAAATGVMDDPQLAALLLAGVVSALACMSLGASLPEDRSTGFLRVLFTHPVRRGALPVARWLGATLALLVALAPALALHALIGVGPPTPGALAAAGALMAVWSVSCALLLGMTLERPAAATGAWFATIALTGGVAWGYLAAPPTSWWSFRLVHVLPGVPLMEALGMVPDPWSHGATTLLAAQCGALAAVALAYGAIGWRFEEPRPLRAASALLVATALLAAATWAFPRAITA